MRNRKKRHGRKHDRLRRGLRLVSPDPGLEAPQQDEAIPRIVTRQYAFDQEYVSRLVVTIMLRLEIPRVASIVGLLGVGPSRNNEDELKKWVAKCLPEIGQESWEEQVPGLCREFVLAIDDARCR
jgi:hypothetical protein